MGSVVSISKTWLGAKHCGRAFSDKPGNNRSHSSGAEALGKERKIAYSQIELVVSRVGEENTVLTLVQGNAIDKESPVTGAVVDHFPARNPRRTVENATGEQISVLPQRLSECRAAIRPSTG